MAIQKEIWTNYIMGNLFKNNEFLNYAYNADQYVLAGKVVHIPQAGAKPGTQRNRTQLPASVTQRTDVDITYAIDEFTSDPILIPNADKIASAVRRALLTRSRRYLGQECREQGPPHRGGTRPDALRGIRKGARRARGLDAVTGSGWGPRGRG